MLVGNLSTVTRLRLVTHQTDIPVRTATAAFADSRIGLIVVCSGRGQAAGVVSKLDLVRHLARDGDPDVPLASIMTTEVAACRPDDDLSDTWQMMTARRRQYLPVLATDRRPLGTLDIRDALEAILREEEARENMLIDYIAGYGYR